MMQIIRFDHQKDLYKKLIQNESFKNELDTLKTFFRESVWWVSEDRKRISPITPGAFKCAICAKKFRKRAACEKKLLAILKKSKKKFLRFDCDAARFGICIPVAQGDRLYGHIVICHSKNKISSDMIPLFTNFIDTLIREIQKESELAKLYKTIRPRAIALSTIHTIHRIISATLNLDELLPRLARLCLQVFRVEVSCILLKSRVKKPIIVRAVSKEKKNKGAISYYRACVKIFDKHELLSKGKVIMRRDKLCAPLTDEDIIGAICVINKMDRAPFDEFDKEILMTLSEQAAIAIKNAQLYKEQEDISIGSIKSVAAILDARAPGTYRVRESFIKIALAMGRELNLNAEDLRNLHYATILHDAGQIAFPDTLLTKTEKLTSKDYSIIKKHPHKSVSIIKHLSFLKPVVPIIFHHHENFDGSGYPKGLKGEKIPLGARVMAVASAFNAMITKRPYRRKVDLQSAISEIKKNAGTQFDPGVVTAFLKVIQTNEISELLKKGL